MHNLRTLLAELDTYSRIEATTASMREFVFTLYTRPTPTQQRAFDLLGVNQERSW